MAAQPGIVQPHRAAVRSGQWAGHNAGARRGGARAGLVGATGTLLDWAAQQSLAGDVMSTPGGEQWAAAWRFITTNPARTWPSGNPGSHSSSPTSAAPGNPARRRLSPSNRSLL